jgi:hypothetical protein
MHLDLEQMKAANAVVADLIRKEGLPDQITPLVFGFTSTGRCSKGAQEIFQLFPHRYITPEELESFNPDPEEARYMLYGVEFTDEHMFINRSTNTFDKAEYRA